jgi:hypothetical protein
MRLTPALKLVGISRRTYENNRQVPVAQGNKTNETLVTGPSASMCAMLADDTISVEDRLDILQIIEQRLLRKRLQAQD